MDITDLFTLSAIAFAGGFSGTFDQTAVGGKVLYSGETLDVMDFIKDNQREDFAYARNRPEQVENKKRGRTPFSS